MAIFSIFTAIFSIFTECSLTSDDSAALVWSRLLSFLYFPLFVDLLVLVMRQIGRASQTRAENERETTTIPSKIVFYLKRKCNNNGNVFPNGQMNGGHPMCVCVCGRSPHEYCTWGNLNILSWLFVFAFDFFFSLFRLFICWFVFSCLEIAMEFGRWRCAPCPPLALAMANRNLRVVQLKMCKQRNSIWDHRKWPCVRRGNKLLNN